jgi:serine/threonine-protein kinase
VSRRGKISTGDLVAGRYRIDEFLGGGGMAVVYVATDTTHDRPAAVKVMQARLARAPEFRERFEREALIATRTFHPHILPVWDSGVHEGVFYIVTPLADFDLAGLMPHDGGMDPQQAIAIVRAIAWALDAAHTHGVVHRDVKPENILIVGDPDQGMAHPYLADFGIAKSAMATTLTVAQAPMSVPYASPEQVRGDRDLTGASDQYSLACTLFDALAGRPPFYYDTASKILDAHMSERPPRISELNGELPAALDEVFERALAKDPAKRYENCQAFGDAAAAALSSAATLVNGGGPVGTTPAPPEPSSEPPPAEDEQPPAGGPRPDDKTVIGDVVAQPPGPGDATIIDAEPRKRQRISAKAILRSPLTFYRWLVRMVAKVPGLRVITGWAPGVAVLLAVLAAAAGFVVVQLTKPPTWEPPYSSEVLDQAATDLAAAYGFDLRDESDAYDTNGCTPQRAGDETALDDTAVARLSCTIDRADGIDAYVLTSWQNEADYRAQADALADGRFNTSTVLPVGSSDVDTLGTCEFAPGPIKWDNGENLCRQTPATWLYWTDDEHKAIGMTLNSDDEPEAAWNTMLLRVHGHQLVAAGDEPTYSQADMKTLRKLVYDDQHTDCYKPAATDITLAGGMPPGAKAAMVCDWDENPDDAEAFTYSAVYALMPTYGAADTMFDHFKTDGTFLTTRSSPAGSAYPCDLEGDEFPTWITNKHPNVDQGKIACLSGYSGPSLMTITYYDGGAVAAMVATRNMYNPTDDELTADRRALWDAFTDSDTGFDTDVSVP